MLVLRVNICQKVLLIKRRLVAIIEAINCDLLLALHRKRNTAKMLPGSVLLCPRPVPDLLGWAYPE